MSKDTRSSYRAPRPYEGSNIPHQDDGSGLTAVVLSESSFEIGSACTWKLPKFEKWWLQQDLASADTPMLGAQGWTGWELGRFVILEAPTR